jgi:hypothetical protein
LVTAAPIKCRYSDVKHDGKINASAVFFDVIKVPHIATKICKEKLWKCTEELSLSLRPFRIKLDEREERIKTFKQGLSTKDKKARKEGTWIREQSLAVLATQ